VQNDLILVGDFSKKGSSSTLHVAEQQTNRTTIPSINAKETISQQATL
jgi:hypothetical protein